MIIKTTSHRSRERLHRFLGYTPQYYWTFEHGGCFVILSDEIGKEAIKIKGITKCRNQNEDKYGKCWS